MVDISTLGIAVEHREVSEAERKIRALERAAHSLEKVVDKLENTSEDAADEIDELGGNSVLASRGFAMAATAAAGFVAALGVGEIIQTADSINLLRGRIGLYTDTAVETEMIISELFDRSREMGASFDGLAETFARIIPAQDQLNLSYEQMLDLSEAVGTAFQVSGASAEEARNATLQLSQAFASGELRGEELRAVMEQGQRIMLALGNQLGATTGELRDMAEAGALTADVVANALLSELPQLRGELEDLPMTAGRGFQSLRTGFTELISHIDRTLGATERLGEIFYGLGEAIEGVNDRFSSDLNVQLAVTRGDIDRLNASLERTNRVLADPAGWDVSHGGMARYQAQAERARQELGDLIIREASLQAAIDSRAEAERRAAAYRARFGTQEEVDIDPLEEIQRLVTELEREAALVGATRAQREVYNEQIRLGRDLTDAEAQAIRAQVQEIERLSVLAADRADKENEALDRMEAMADQKAREFEAEAEARENNLRLAEYQLDAQIRIAELAGDQDTLLLLERERDIRREIVSLMDMGLDAEEARSMAANNADLRDTARRQGAIRETVRDGLQDGIAAWVETGDASAIGRSIAAAIADNMVERMADRASDLLIGLIFDEAQATISGIAQGTAAGTAMSSSITTAGGIAAAQMQTAIITAGSSVAEMIAQAAATEGGGGAGNTLMSLISGGRATGGGVRPGGIYAVNEVRQEFFAPLVPGRIVPVSTAAPQPEVVERVRTERIIITEGEMFAARVEEISGPIAAREGQKAATSAQIEHDDRRRKGGLRF